ncbi:MAG: hypothetical protein HYX53_16420 [Chloroflexi bacterium]|nr:hypothetical protein [Chloroflexota bacterium]
MYSIRVDSVRNLLVVELTGRVTTAEALRAVSQGFTLAEAGSIWAISCDLTAVRRGPGGMLVVAAAVASRLREGMQVALIGGRQRAFAERLMRFSGAPDALHAFDDAAAAQAWLTPLLRKPPRISETERRHASTIVGPAAAATQPRRRATDPAA